ncbi:hypothetical protein KAT08_00405 [Candidatus Babeliales bacterium]|nr:hypothetical protein [Candidatus Babeliales bacterium]
MKFLNKTMLLAITTTLVFASSMYPMKNNQNNQGFFSKLNPFSWFSSKTNETDAIKKENLNNTGIGTIEDPIIISDDESEEITSSILGKRKRNESDNEQNQANPSKRIKLEKQNQVKILQEKTNEALKKLTEIQQNISFIQNDTNPNIEQEITQITLNSLQMILENMTTLQQNLSNSKEELFKKISTFEKNTNDNFSETEKHLTNQDKQLNDQIEKISKLQLELNKALHEINIIKNHITKNKNFIASAIKIGTITTVIAWIIKIINRCSTLTCISNPILLISSLKWGFAIGLITAIYTLKKEFLELIKTYENPSSYIPFYKN